MTSHVTQVRVRYADTDQGGVVYNANYLVFFEAGRTEMMREMGVPYAALERDGYIMPVVEAHVGYHAPARYDDLLDVESEVTQVRRVRLRIDTRVFLHGEGRLLAEGWMWLACTQRETGRATALPADLREAVERWNSGKSP